MHNRPRWSSFEKSIWPLLYGFVRVLAFTKSGGNEFSDLIMHSIEEHILWYFKSPLHLFTSYDVNHSQQSCCISFHHAIDDMQYPFHCNLSFPTLVSFSYVKFLNTYGHHLHLVYNFPYSILYFFLGGQDTQNFTK